VTERIGDVSYGVYLFGWPVGLLAATRANTANPLVVFALSVPVVFAFAYAMHRLVEVPVNVSVKPWVFRWLPRLPIGGRCGESRRATCAELAAGRASAARALASGFCLVMVARFVIYPYPFGSNWFGSQVYQLLGICAVTALIVKAGDFWESRGSLAVPVTAVGTSPDQA
jgi:peptidoglycan/LPS O-acetylase OafA/YrhL